VSIRKKILRRPGLGWKYSLLRRCAAVSAVVWDGSLIRSRALHEESEFSHDQPGNPRADSPLLLRRALEDRHHCQ
jgi:hypothetical protein